MNLFAYRDEIKRALLDHVARFDAEPDPFVGAWLAYAFSQEGFQDNPIMMNLVHRLSVLAQDEAVLLSPRNLGPLCLIAYLRQQIGLQITDYSEMLSSAIENLQDNTSKFSPVNDPEQVFPMALFVSCLQDGRSARDTLRLIIRSRSNGTLKRRIIYKAALRELGDARSFPNVDEAPSDPGDIIGLVWFWERYGDRAGCARWWSAFEKIKDIISSNRSEREDLGMRVLSVTELSLLYEALVRETLNPDPILLFQLYPLHPRVQDVSTSLFMAGEYKNAVEEAAKALSAHIQQRTGSTKSEAELVRAVMQPPTPKLIMTAFPIASESGKNEQKGLYLIADGIFTAFRNPKAHSAKDDPKAQIDAEEALDQLIIISYMFKRVDRATFEK
jgi:uncharacterized protein (TIGR02391 family)